MKIFTADSDTLGLLVGFFLWGLFTLLNPFGILCFVVGWSNPYWNPFIGEFTIPSLSFTPAKCISAFLSAVIETVGIDELKFRPELSIKGHCLGLNITFRRLVVHTSVGGFTDLSINSKVSGGIAAGNEDARPEAVREPPLEQLIGRVQYVFNLLEKVGLRVNLEVNSFEIHLHDSQADIESLPELYLSVDGFTVHSEVSDSNKARIGWQCVCLSAPSSVEYLNADFQSATQQQYPELVDASATEQCEKERLRCMSPLISVTATHMTLAVAMLGDPRSFGFRAIADAGISVGNVKVYVDVYSSSSGIPVPVCAALNRLVLSVDDLKPYMGKFDFERLCKTLDECNSGANGKYVNSRRQSEQPLHDGGGNSNILFQWNFDAVISAICFMKRTVDESTSLRVRELLVVKNLACKSIGNHGLASSNIRIGDVQQTGYRENMHIKTSGVAGAATVDLQGTLGADDQDSEAKVEFLNMTHRFDYSYSSSASMNSTGASLVGVVSPIRLVIDSEDIASLVSLSTQIRSIFEVSSRWATTEALYSVSPYQKVSPLPRCEVQVSGGGAIVTIKSSKPVEDAIQISLEPYHVNIAQKTEDQGGENDGVQTNQEGYIRGISLNRVSANGAIKLIVFIGDVLVTNGCYGNVLTSRRCDGVLKDLSAPTCAALEDSRMLITSLFTQQDFRIINEIKVQAVTMDFTPADLELLAVLRKDMSITAPTEALATATPTSVEIITVPAFPSGAVELEQFNFQLNRLSIDMHFYDDITKATLPPRRKRYALELDVPPNQNPFAPQNTYHVIKQVPFRLRISPSSDGEEGCLSLQRYCVAGGVLSSVEVSMPKSLHATLSSLDFSKTSGSSKESEVRSLVLFKVVPMSSGVSSSCIYSSQRFPTDVMRTFKTAGHKHRALVCMTSHSLLELDSIEADVDAYNVSCINKFLESMKIHSIPAPQDPELLPVTLSADPASIHRDPTSLIYTRVNSVNIGFTRDLNRNGIFSFSCANLEVSKLSFGGNLEQTAIFLRGVKVIDHTEPRSVLKNLVYSTDKDNGCVNTIEMHLSRLKGEQTLCEVKVSYLRVLWLQRGCMGIINFMNLYFQHEMKAAPEKPFVHRTLQKPAFHPDQIHKGRFRLGITIKDSEVHLPSASVGTDALVFLLHDSTVFLNDPMISKKSDGLRYLNGPLVSPAKLNVNEIQNMRKCVSALRRPISSGPVSTSTTARRRPTVWMLLVYADHLRAPVSLYRKEGERYLNIDLHFELRDVSICSWCSHNIIGENINLTITFHIQPADLLGDELYDEVKKRCMGLDPSDAQTAIPRNSTTVDIKSNHVIDWTLTQGQYFLIVAFIMYNFDERVNFIPDKNPLPPNMNAPLNGEYYGETSIDLRMPCISAVPVLIPMGSIKCIEDRSEYHTLIGTQLRPLSRGEGSYMSGISGTESDKDAVPGNSYHYEHHRKKLLKSHRQKMSRFGFYNDRLSQTIFESFSRNMDDGDFETKTTDASKVLQKPSRRKSNRASVTELDLKELTIREDKDWFDIDSDNDSDIDSDNDSDSDSDNDSDSTDDDSDSTDDDKKGNHSRGNVEQRDDDVVTQIIYFQQLRLNFKRRHFAGGSSIEASSLSLMLCRDFKSSLFFDIDAMFNDDMDEDAELKRDSVFQVNDTNDDNIDDAEFGDAYDTECDIYSYGYNTQARRVEFIKNLKNIPIDTILLGSREAIRSGHEMLPNEPHISYYQQGVTNLRRCLISLQDSLVVGHLGPILNLIPFWTEPIGLIALRKSDAIQQHGFGPFDFKAGLEVEVDARNCTIALPLNPRDRKNVFMSNSKNRDDQHDTTDDVNYKGLCLDIENIVYRLTDRGFLRVGPGTRSNYTYLKCRKIFIETIASAADTIEEASLIEAFELKVDYSHFVVPSNPPEVMVSQPPSPHPFNEVVGVESNPKVLDKWIDFSQRFHTTERDRKRISSDSRRSTRPHLLMNLKIILQKSSVTEKARKPSPAKTRRRGINPSEYSYSGGVHSALNNGANMLEDPVLRIRVSLKDIKYASGVIDQCKASLRQRIARIPVKSRYSKLLSSCKDLALAPLMTFSAIHTNVKGKALKPTKTNEVHTSVPDISICIRNNIYNLNITEVVLESLNINYTRSLQHLHAALSLRASAWLHSEYFNKWEPIMEPVSANIVLSDGKKVSGKHRVRIDAKIDPIELVVSETAMQGMIRKVYLADMVTTSSVHLPPYRLINVLGTPVEFKILYSGHCSISGHIPIDGEKAVDAKTLSTSGSSQGEGSTEWYTGSVSDYLSRIDDNYLGADVDGTISKGVIDNDKERMITFSCQIDGIIYTSDEPFSLDLDGSKTIQLIPEESKQTNDTDAQVERSTSSDDPISSEASRDSMVTTETSRSSASVVSSITMSPSRVKSARILGKGSSMLSSVLSAFNQDAMSNNVENIPITASITSRVKGDGGRELVLSSALSFRNQTAKSLELQVNNQFYKRKASAKVAPGEKWNCPINLSYSSSSLSIRLVGVKEWTPALGNFRSLVIGGTWEFPTRLGAEVVSISKSSPVEMNTPSNESSKPSTTSWICLMRPEVSMMTKSGGYTFVPIRMPTSEGDFQTYQRTNDRQEHGVHSNTMCIALQAPLTLSNITAQPLLYRVADIDGMIQAEGVLIPGECCSIHHLSSIFAKRLYISLRMVNYGWSNWTPILNRSSPYISSEKVSSILIPSLDFRSLQEMTRELPTLQLEMSIINGFIRFYSKIVVSNRTGLELDICESNDRTRYTSHNSLVAANLHIYRSFFEDKVERLSAISDDTNQGNGEGIGNKPLLNTKTESDVPENIQEGGFVLEAGADKGISTLRSGLSANLTGVHVRQHHRINVTLVIQMPYDHLESQRVVVDSEMTLRDVFLLLSDKLSANPVYQQFGYYEFFAALSTTFSADREKPFISVGTVTSETTFPFGRRIHFSPQVEQSSTSNLAAIGIGQGASRSSRTNQKINSDHMMSISGKYQVALEEAKRGGALNRGTVREDKRFPVCSSAPDMDEFVQMPPMMSPGMAFSSHDIHLPMKMTIIEVIQKFGDSSVQGALSNISCKNMAMRLRLAHKTEISIYDQICSAKEESKPESRTSIMRSASTTTTYTFSLFKNEGDFPFRPSRLLGLSPVLSIRVPSETDWSDGIDVMDSTFGGDHSGVRHFSMEQVRDLQTRKTIGGHNETSTYEFGTFVERGGGFFEGINTLTIVPKHILICKLNHSIEVRQIGTFHDFQVALLEPNSVKVWHFPKVSSKGTVKLVQIRRKGQTAWTGEVDISNIGSVYVQLRNPYSIFKVDVELVGGSLVSTISEGEVGWPPFRIRNNSSVDIRFRQIPKTDDAVTNASGGTFTLYNKGDEHFPYDDLQSDSECSYYWDHPVSAMHILEIGFHHESFRSSVVSNRANTIWTTERVPLEDVTGKVIEVIVRGTVKNLRSAQAEGCLYWNSPSQGWVSVYSILVTDTLYLFRDESRAELVDIVNFSRSTTDEYGQHQIQLAKITRYFNQDWDMVGAISGIIETQGKEDGGQDESLDSNKMRIFLLKVADTLELFKSEHLSLKGVEVQFNNLLEAIESGATVDQLFDILGSKPVKARQIPQVLLEMGASDNEDSAKSLFKVFISQEFIRAEDRGHIDIDNIDMNLDVLLHAPVLHHEMLTMADSNDSTDSGRTGDEFGFTISLEEVSYDFKCQSKIEFLGWIQACRQSVEQSWIQHLRDEQYGDKQKTMRSFERIVCLKVSVNGPTKVLDIYDYADKDSESKGDTDSTVVEKKWSRNSPKTSKKGSTVRAFEKVEKKFSKIRQTEVLSTVALHSIGFSIIDGDYAEIMHFSMEDFGIRMENTTNQNQASVTIQRLLISNQLLSARNHVTLHQVDSAKHQTSRGAKKLMLPGLEQSGDSYPAFHFFSQQKANISSSEDMLATRTSRNINNDQHITDEDVLSDDEQDKALAIGTDDITPVIVKEKKKMIIYDMVTCWISPLVINLEGEQIVRMMRFQNSIHMRLSSKGHNENVKDARKSRSSGTSQIVVDPRIYEMDNENYARLIQQGYSTLMHKGRRHYTHYDPSTHGAIIYFSVLQLHPIDISTRFFASPTFTPMSNELTLLNLISQLDGSRVKLNALLAEHANGTIPMIRSVLVKHYQSCILRQVHHLIGQTDIVEGSLGLVANLGTGVYDLFYEPIDSLLDSDGSFLKGLSKGSISLASHTVGGGAAQFSKVTGGIGKGMSLLTLDSEYNDKRSMRKLKKAAGLGEGVIVGAQELGTDLYDGVTGILSQPIRGYTKGGLVGGGIGLGRGLIGFAVKPVVGVFDLASRATEGIRNAAFDENNADKGKEAYLHGTRLPRSFGRSDLLLPYSLHPAAAQYLAIKLAGFPICNPPLRVVFHLNLKRSIIVNKKAPMTEAWGMQLNQRYIAMICTDRIMLVRYSSSKNSPAVNASLIWTCPGRAIEQFTSDTNGDMIITPNEYVKCCNDQALKWDCDSPALLTPAIDECTDYFQFQLVLEKTIGSRLARLHPLYPPKDSFMCTAYKVFSTGMKKYFMKPRKCSYHLYGNVLYEFVDKKTEVTGQDATDADPEPGKRLSRDRSSAGELDREEMYHESAYVQILNSIFGGEDEAENANTTEPIGQELHAGQYLSYVYPLVDIKVLGPKPERHFNKDCFTITFARIDSKSLRCMKRDFEFDVLQEHHKASVTLIFETEELASKWKLGLEAARIYQPKDVWNGENSYVDESQKKAIERRKQISLDELITSSAESAEMVQRALGTGQGDLFRFDWKNHSIAGKLVIPSSGADANDIEKFKVQIGITLSKSRLQLM
eukprot:GSChrysophyteH1.ASY1.ANO1.386.1 assembled CDS